MIWAALSTRTSTSAEAAVAASIPRAWTGLWRSTGFSMPSNAPKSMLPGIHPVADDGGLAERLGGLQPVQALDQHETLAVGAHLDRHLLAVLEHALGDLGDALLVERFAPLDRHVDLGDREILAFHHGGATLARPCAGRIGAQSSAPSGQPKDVGYVSVGRKHSRHFVRRSDRRLA